MPRWDDLEMFTNEEDSVGGMFCWEVGLGRVLAAVRRKDWSGLETNLQVQIIFFCFDFKQWVLWQIARTGLMEGLTADGGAYSRGYLNITRFILSFLLPFIKTIPVFSG